VPIPRKISWTGWLLVLVYFGGLTAISTFVVHKIGIEVLLFYEVFLKVLLFTAIVYILTSVHNSLENKEWTERRSNIIIKTLVVVFAIIGAGYMFLGLGQILSLDVYANDATFEVELHEQDQTVHGVYVFTVAFFTSNNVTGLVVPMPTLPEPGKVFCAFIEPAPIIHTGIIIAEMRAFLMLLYKLKY